MTELKFTKLQSWIDKVKKLYPNYIIVKGLGYGGENGWDAVPSLESDFQSDVVATFDEDESCGLIFVM